MPLSPNTRVLNIQQPHPQSILNQTVPLKFSNEKRTSYGHILDANSYKQQYEGIGNQNFDTTRILQHYAQIPTTTFHQQRTSSSGITPKHYINQKQSSTPSAAYAKQNPKNLLNQTTANIFNATTTTTTIQKQSSNINLRSKYNRGQNNITAVTNVTNTTTTTTTNTSATNVSVTPQNIARGMGSNHNSRPSSTKNLLNKTCSQIPQKVLVNGQIQNMRYESEGPHKVKILENSQASRNSQPVQTVVQNQYKTNEPQSNIERIQ